MNLDDRANGAQTTVVLFGNADATLYRLLDDELTQAENVGDPDGFPEYGWFASCEAVAGDGSTLGDRWLEMPAGLAEALGNADVEPGDVFRVAEKTKDVEGNWQVTVEKLAIDADT